MDRKRRTFCPNGIGHEIDVSIDIRLFPRFSPPLEELSLLRWMNYLFKDKRLEVAAEIDY